MRQVTFGGKLSKLPSYEIIRIRYDKIDMKKNYELLRNRNSTKTIEFYSLHIYTNLRSHLNVKSGCRSQKIAKI